MASDFFVSLPVIEAVSAKIVHYLELLRTENICESGINYLFLSQQGNPISRSEVYRIVHTLLREAGERVNARLLVGQADAAGLSRWEREYGLADRSGEDGARRRARIYAAMAGGQTLTRERLSALAVAVGGADRGEVTEDFAAYAVELAAIQDGRLPAPEGMAALREAIARQKGAHLTVTAVPKSEAKRS